MASFFFFFLSEPRRCSGRRVACEDIEGLQPTRLPLQVTRMTWIIETSVSPLLVTTLLLFRASSPRDESVSPRRPDFRSARVSSRRFFDAGLDLKAEHRRTPSLLRRSWL